MDRIAKLELEAEFIQGWNAIYTSLKDLLTKHKSLAATSPTEHALVVERAKNGLYPDYRRWPEIDRFFEVAFDREYNRQLRPGRSLAAFVVSRSLRYGLRVEQPSIEVSFIHNTLQVSHNLRGHREEFTTDISFNDSVDVLFRELVERPLD